MSNFQFSNKDLELLSGKKGIYQLLKKKNIDISKILKTLKYETELYDLQVELIKMQNWVKVNKKRVAIIFEGRDAAGKGGTIRRFIEHMNPRSFRVVALNKPTETEKGQWYFQRYIKQLPDIGEIVFFDRSWYNRAVVEPVNGFCSYEEYELFMNQVGDFEKMIKDSGVSLIKFWLDTSKNEQAKRFKDRNGSPLKQWKISPIDKKAQELWDVYTDYRDKMFERTHSNSIPWVIIKADNKKKARLAAIRHVLNSLEYDGKAADFKPDKNVISLYKK